jgi:hypothetical protein
MSNLSGYTTVEELELLENIKMFLKKTGLGDD